MKSKLQSLTTILFILFVFCNCTQQNSKNTDKELPTQQDVTLLPENNTPPFPLPKVPIIITNPQEGAIYLSKHFWDKFPFTDTTFISQPDITEQGFVDYIQILNNIPHKHAESSLENMLNKAQIEPAMYDHFISLSEKYFYDPNSPFRNDELYIPVVSHLLQSGMLSETKEEVYRFQQTMILKNRVGTKATDFVYTLANGDKKNLHALKSDYLILFFTNPDCPMCATTTQQLNSSEVLKSISSLNTPNKKLLTFLTVYPDSNIDEWRKALPSLPQKNWVNAYDAGTIVTNKRLYDIKAIPTLYLLNKDKQVILKDTSFEEIEEYFMNIRR